MNKLRVLELFGGIGACTKALENLDIPHEVVDYVEINNEAVKSYNALHNTNFEPQDITKWDKDIQVDLIMHGSPCQDFSKAGKQASGIEGSGTRSSLIYETVRIITKLKPKYVIWENVENALKEPHIHVVEDYLYRLEQLGYTNNYKLTTASYYGIPQERKRVICVSILNGDKFEFPNEEIKSNNLEDYIDFRPQDDLTFNFFRRYKEIKNPDATEQDFVDYINSLPISKGIGSMKMGLYTFGEMDTITTINGRTGTLTCRNVQNYNKKFWYNNKLYKPSPKMCWRLMGFSDNDFAKASEVNEDTALYNQAGNSIVVNVLMSIFNKLLGEYNE